MESLTSISDDRKPPRLRWIIPFLSFEVANAAGALLGVALLDMAWVGGLGLFNLKLSAAIGVLPSLILSFWISRLRNVSLIFVTAASSMVAFTLSSLFSYHFSIAMAGV